MRIWKTYSNSYSLKGNRGKGFIIYNINKYNNIPPYSHPPSHSPTDGRAGIFHILHIICLKPLWGLALREYKSSYSAIFSIFNPTFIATTETKYELFLRTWKQVRI